MYQFIYNDNDWSLHLELDNPNVVEIWFNDEFLAGLIHLNKEIICNNFSEEEEENENLRLESLLKSKEFEQAFTVFKEILKVTIKRLKILLEPKKDVWLTELKEKIYLNLLNWS
jgi:hypothetical protein